MVDALTVFAIGVPYFLGMIGFRIGIFRGIFLELQNRSKEREDAAYSKFEALLFAMKTKEPDPEQTLNHAAQYLSWTRIGDDLSDLYRANKREIGMDLAGVALSVGYVIFAYPHIRADFQSFLHFLVLAGIGLISLIYSISSLNQINTFEKKLGIGVMKHRFDFLNRNQD